MKRLFYIVAVILCQKTLAADAVLNDTNMALKSSSGSIIAGSQATSIDDLLLKAQSLQQRGTFTVILQTDLTVTISDSTAPPPDPTPTPTPDPTPTPTPDPTPGTQCTANADPANYLSVLNTATVICLADGIYLQGLNVPSNKTVQAANRGKAVFTGGDSSWSAILQMNGSGSIVDGLKVHHPDNSTSDACAINGINNTMRNTSCSHGGSHKHKIPLKLTGSGHLIEDSWFYGEGRYVVQCFGGSNMTIRNNVARWDSTIANEPGEPNATFSVYACSDMTIENNVSVDYGVPATRMRFGGDFYMPAHNNIGQVPNNNIFTGNVAYNHAADTDNRRGIRLDPDMTVTGVVIENMIVNGSDRGYMLSATAQSTAIGNCEMTNVATVGASCTLVQLTLPAINNEALIKDDMCNASERQSDWCLTNLSLSEYLAQ